MREMRAECHRLDIAGLEQAGRARRGGGAARSARDYERAADEFERRGGDLLGALSRLRDAGAVELWTSAPPTRCCRCSRPSRALQLQLRPASPRTGARFGAWSGGFWLPECAYRPGLDEQLAERRRAGLLRRPDRGTGTSLDQLAPRRDAGGPGRRADRLADGRAGLGRATATRPTRVYRDYHARRSTACAPWANGGARRTTAEAARARAREHARDFVARVAGALDGTAPRAGGPGLIVRARHRAARPLVVRGARLAGGRVRGSAARRASASRRFRRRSSGTARRRGRSASRAGARARTCAPGTRPAVAEIAWAASEAELRSSAALGGSAPTVLGARPSAPRRARRARAARAAVERLGLHGDARAGGRLSGAARARPRARLRHAIGALADGMKDFRSMSARTSDARRSNGPAELRSTLACAASRRRLELAPLVAPSSPGASMGGTPGA